MFLLVPAYPGCPGSKAVKRSLLLLLLLTDDSPVYHTLSVHLSPAKLITLFVDRYAVAKFSMSCVCSKVLLFLQVPEFSYSTV